MSYRDRDLKVTGYKPNCPVNDGQVAWAKAKLPELEALCAAPDQQNAAVHAIFKQLAATMIAVYAPMGRKVDESMFEAYAQQSKVLIEDIASEMILYPAWAVEAGFKAYRRSEQGKWMPRTAGELLPHVKAEYGIARKSLQAAKRIVNSDRNDFNVDRMLKLASQATEGKERGELALKFANKLEETGCTIGDKVADGPYRYLRGEWKKYKATRSEDHTALLSGVTQSVTACQQQAGSQVSRESSEPRTEECDGDQPPMI